MSASGGVKAIIYAFSANLGIGITKTVAAVMTSSGTMMAEAIHSYADCTNQLLLFLGMKRASKPATKKNPLGHGKALYFWSFIVALLLFSMGGMYSLYEGIHKLMHPQPMESPFIALAVLGVSILLEGASLRGAIQEIKPEKKNQTYVQWFRNSRQSQLLVIFAEDVAALFGLALAFIAVLTAYLTQNPIYDSLGTIAIGALLIVISVAIGVEVKSLLIGESASEEEENLIKKHLKNDPSVEKVINLITVEHGNELIVAVKAQMKNTTTRKLVDNINRLEKELKEVLPRIRQTFFEPDMKE